MVTKKYLGNFHCDAAGHLRRTPDGPVVQLHQYHQARQKRTDQPKDLDAFDLAVLENFGGVREADEAAEAQRRALAPKAVAAPVVKAFRTSATDLAATVTPGWQPGEAHFTGKPSEHAGVEEKGPSASRDALEALAAEIERRRRNR